MIVPAILMNNSNSLSYFVCPNIEVKKSGFDMSKTPINPINADRACYLQFFPVNNSPHKNY